jgi:hypothetical protein
MLKKVRQLIESVNDTLKGQLDLEFHGGRTSEGVAVRVAQRALALVAAVWFNNMTGAPVTRSLSPSITEHFGTTRLGFGGDVVVSDGGRG